MRVASTMPVVKNGLEGDVLTTDSNELRVWLRRAAAIEREDATEDSLRNTGMMRPSFQKFALRRMIKHGNHFGTS